jgi:hypothetical protein
MLVRAAKWPALGASAGIERPADWRSEFGGPEASDASDSVEWYGGRVLA